MKVLSKRLESELAERICDVAKSGFPITATKLRQCAFILARENKIKGFSPNNKRADREWLKGFFEWHCLNMCESCEMMKIAQMV